MATRYGRLDATTGRQRVPEGGLQVVAPKVGQDVVPKAVRGVVQVGLAAFALEDLGREE